MRLAVRFYRDNPDKPAEIPGDYPWECVQDNTPEFQDRVRQGWVVMSFEEYNAYKASLQAPVDAYHESLPVLVADVESDEVKELKAQVAALTEAIAEMGG